MGTMKAKIDSANEQSAATVEIKVGKKTETVVDADLADLLEQGWAGYDLSQEAHLHYKEARDRIAEFAREKLGERGTITLKGGKVVCKITFGYECAVPEDNVAPLKALLRDMGKDPDDLLRSKTTWTGTGKLIELAADADKGRKVRDWIVIREKSPSVSFDLNEEGA